MSCRDFQPLLSKFAGSQTSVDPLEHAALRKHLAICPHCLHAAQSLAEWDEQLVHSMNDVAVPKGLSQTISRALIEAAADGPQTIPSVSKPSLRTVASRILGSLSITCVVVFAIWSTWLFARPPMLSAVVVPALLQESADGPSTANNSRPPLPQRWSSLAGKVVLGAWRRLKPSNLRVTIDVASLEVRSKHGPSVEGSLFVVPKSRWNASTMKSSAQAAIQYAPPHVWIAWPERDLVYILSLDGPAPLLEQLQRQLDGHHTVL